jgi:hypothetical protein
MAAPFPADDSMVFVRNRVSGSIARLLNAAIVEWVNCWGLVA